jgi:DNA-binding CsgD family transcriptional regulator
VRRQQTLRASVDWSHALLTEPEQVLFRRLAAFAGGFDLDAAQAVGAGSEVELYQLMDQLGLLVDKSLVVAEDTAAGMRYRLLETVRQYAQEKLGESGEAAEVRSRHRDYYTAKALELESLGQAGIEPLLLWAHVEIDNVRAAFAWSRENSDDEAALRLVSSLQEFTLRRGRFREALAGFDAILTDERPEEIAPGVWAHAVADHGILAGWVAVPASLDRAREALAVARRLNDPELIGRALVACGMLSFYSAEIAKPYFAEAIDLARATGARRTLCEIFAYQAATAAIAGEAVAARAAAEEGRDLADALGDRFISVGCRAWLGASLFLLGDLPHAVEVLRCLGDEAAMAGDLPLKVLGDVAYGYVLAHQGQAAAAHAAAQSALRAAEAVGGYYGDSVYATLAAAALAGGDAAAARQAVEEAWRHTVPERELHTSSFTPTAEAILACGDLTAARQWADKTVRVVPGCHRTAALTIRAFVASAQGEPDQAERDAQDALANATRTQAYRCVPDALECLAHLATDGTNDEFAARLLGAAEAIRQRTRYARFPMYKGDYDATVRDLRETLGQNDFDAAWAEGAGLSTEEAIAYAQRGRGERKRPTSGWGSLTPMENDVVRLVVEGLGNKDIGARLFISPRTVQTHLTHVYAKLGLTSRVQLVQETGRRG